MSENQWFYVRGGDSSGPIPQSDLVYLLESGAISQATLVWKEGMAEWQRADELAEFQALHIATDAEVPAAASPKKTVDLESALHQAEAEENPPQPHPSFQATVRATPAQPWARYFARMLDLTLAQLLYFNVGGQAAVVFDVSVMAQLSIPFLACWVLVESALLSTWGTTPGKWLMRIELTDERGERLQFKAALKRSLQVWIRGMALGIPILTPLAQLHAYSVLMQKGVTSWDSLCNTVVRHHRIPPMRWLAVLFLLYAVYTNVKMLGV